MPKGKGRCNAPGQVDQAKRLQRSKYPVDILKEAIMTKVACVLLYVVLSAFNWRFIIVYRSVVPTEFVVDGRACEPLRFPSLGRRQA